MPFPAVKQHHWPGADRAGSFRQDGSRPWSRRAGVVFINPGSAGPRRFRLPISVGDIMVDGTSMRPRTVELVVPTAS